MEVTVTISFLLIFNFGRTGRSPPKFFAMLLTRIRHLLRNGLRMMSGTLFGVVLILKEILIFSN